MSKPIESQVKLGAETKARLTVLGVEQTRLARELNRSDVAIHRALRGERAVLLGRIIRWIERYERRKQSTKQNRPVAA
jgi:hypothetical protein